MSPFEMIHILSLEQFWNLFIPDCCVLNLIKSGPINNMKMCKVYNWTGYGKQAIRKNLCEVIHQVNRISTHTEVTLRHGLPSWNNVLPTARWSIPRNSSRIFSTFLYTLSDLTRSNLQYEINVLYWLWNFKSIRRVHQMSRFLQIGSLSLISTMFQNVIMKKWHNVLHTYNQDIMVTDKKIQLSTLIDRYIFHNNKFLRDFKSL
jgi:hypothetical protein